ncbi:MAG: hypothetical protein PVJ09_03805 [Candidatus Woesebacteria bacterium]|jgi:hypothetical protein
MPKFSKLIFLFTLFIIANLIALWIFSLSTSQKLKQFNQNLEKILGSSSETDTEDSSLLADSTLGEEKSSSIDTQVQENKASIASLAAEIQDLKSRITALEKKPAAKSTIPQSSAQPAVKEYFVYLGTGSTTSREWTDMSSAVAYINSSNYPKVKNIELQAALSIIGGEVHARLINKTTGHIFHNSEIFHNTSSSTWKSSPALALTAGNNQYMVQIKSTSGEKAQLDGSRIKIVIE